jgi:hypothetical protein
MSIEIKQLKNFEKSFHSGVSGARLGVDFEPGERLSGALPGRDLVRLRERDDELVSLIRLTCHLCNEVDALCRREHDVVKLTFD